MLPSTFSALPSTWHVRALNPEVIPDSHLQDVLSAGIEAHVPGEAVVALLDVGLIDDPYDGSNEATLQWVGDVDWEYSTTFTPTAEQLSHTRQDLVCYGIDTVADIRINSRVVGHTDNYYLTYRFDVRPYLHAGENEITISLTSPVRYSNAREQKIGFLPHTEHHAFNQIRKPSSQFGWDWGIDIANSGIWQPIGLDCWDGERIDSVRPLVSLEENGSARIEVITRIEREGVNHAITTNNYLEGRSDVPVHVSLTAPDGTLVCEEEGVVENRRNEAHVVLHVENPQLWWPLGYGEQPLYHLSVSTQHAHAEHNIGLRSVAINTSVDDAGRAFQIIINNTPIHAHGYNWIPGDALLTRFDSKRYEAAFRDLVESNSNMIRVWGGGIYETDTFYELADRYGIMVWQDFMLACGAYPEDPETVASITQEAEQQIIRLSSHPSLVVWNGSNENYVAHADWGYQPMLRDDDLPRNSRGYSEKGWGDLYYSQIFPKLLRKLDPTHVYLPSSPMSFTDQVAANSDRDGTIHIWDVWNRRDYKAYRDYHPRFVDEFGYQAPPAWSTLVGSVHDEPLSLEGKQMLTHQKANLGQVKLARGMRSHLTPGSISDVTINPDGSRSWLLPSDEWADPQDWHWATQLQQAHAIEFGVAYMRSLEPVNAGALIWQLNDDWPVVSWAAVDFDGHRKPLWYASQRVFAPRFATIQEEVSDKLRDALSFEGVGEFTYDQLSLIAVNDTRETWSGEWTVSRQTFAGEVRASETITATIEAGQQLHVILPDNLKKFDEPTNEIIVATAEGFEQVIYNPSEVIDQQLQAPKDAFNSRVTKLSDTSYELTVTAKSYTRDLFCMVDKVDPQARITGGLVSLPAGQSVTWNITTSHEVDPQAFFQTNVLRSANDLNR